MKKVFKIKKYLIISMIIFIFTLSFVNFNTSNTKIVEDVAVINYSDVSERVVYLSDIPYRKAQVGWGNIAFDKTQSNTALSMLLDGSTTVFNKGIWAHATSTLEYDISAYNNEYAYFSTYYGIYSGANNAGNGVKFYVYTSVDGTNWDLRTEQDPPAMKVVNNAVYVKVDIRGANYIKLYAYDNGSNSSDNSIWADAKLVKEDYQENIMTTVEEFDKIIKSRYASGVVGDDLKLTLLQRNFIKNVGQYQLRNFVEASERNRETLEWFIHNEEALRLWTIGGRPNGTYQRALQVLSDLYSTYKEDLQNEGVTNYGTKYKDLYLRMMLSLSLTHSANVGLWIGGNQLSNAVNRYQIYKQMHLDNMFGSNAMFESYTIDEMRGVMATNIDDEEILWLHDYSKKYDSVSRFNPYKYINYTFNYGYYRPQYYSKENYAKWDQKYNLSKYNVPYQAGKPKLWIVFEEGAVCGGLSKTAANLYGVWGYPARVVGQPGHAAYVYLYNAGGGNYAWQLANSAVTTGWANTTGGGINGWGSKYATNNGTIKPGSYLLLSQQAQNEYDKYEKAELIYLLQDVYKNDRKKLEQIYRDMLNEEIINLDAWIGLVDLYITDQTKTEDDLIALAEEIAEVYTFHPLPMYDLTRRIGSKITTSAYRSRLMMLQDEALRKATKATSKDTIYTKEIPVIANALLGVVDSRIATFSFDGTDAGKIVLSKQLQSAQVSWTYSIDGGNTWLPCYENFVQLTKKQLDSITAEKDIKVHITGLPTTPENIYTIDIKKGVFPSNTVSIDDLENKVNGTNDKMEWTLDPNSGEWTSFAESNPIFKGDVVVYIRMLATGVNTMSDPVYFTFTMNASSESNRYIPRSNLKVVSVSGTYKGTPNYILDGNFNTYWAGKISSFGGRYPGGYAVVELDKPRYVSEIDYAPYANAKTPNGGYPTGKAKKIEIYVSMDGKNWELAGLKDNIGNNGSLKKIKLNEPRYSKYVKINFSSIYESGLEHYVTMAVLNVYEDPSASVIPTAEVNYNIINKTNKDVVAELVNENRPITVTNNNGQIKHTFTENGEFTFEFVDINGNKGTATAVVDWIDKTPPTVEVEFSTTELTNQDVVATLAFSKVVTILSDDVQVTENPVDGSKLITFLDNATYELKFADSLGNIGTKTITVDWIDKEAPKAEFIYSTMHITDKPVTVTLDPSEEITVLNNDGKDYYTFTNNGEFTFEFIDVAGNKGIATAIVTWITDVPEYKLEYSTKELTKENVIVSVTIEDGYSIVNNNDSNIFEFTKNGNYSIDYLDKNRNLGSIPISITWIDKESPQAELKYEYLKDKVIVSVVNPSEEITFKEGNGVYEFTENGSYEIIFYDKVLNEGKLTAIIEIKKEEENKPDDNIGSNDNENNNQDNNSNNDYNNDVVVDNTIPNYDIYNDSKDSIPVIDDSEIQNRKYTDNIIIEIPDNLKDKVNSISTDKFKPSKKLKDKFGNESEYYQISLLDKEAKKVKLDSATPLKIKIKLDNKKKFKGIYKVFENDKFERLNYIKNGDVIEIDSSDLDKYILSYEDPNLSKTNEKTEVNKNNYIVIITALLVALSGISVYTFRKILKK